LRTRATPRWIYVFSGLLRYISIAVYKKVTTQRFINKAKR